MKQPHHYEPPRVVKIVEGKRYDTQSALMLAYAKVYGYGDMSADDVYLYRKRNGSYFLACGKDVTPLTIDEAKQWSEKHLPWQRYETIFGKVSE